LGLARCMGEMFTSWTLYWFISLEGWGGGGGEGINHEYYNQTPILNFS